MNIIGLVEIRMKLVSKEKNRFRSTDLKFIRQVLNFDMDSR